MLPNTSSIIFLEPVAAAPHLALQVQVVLQELPHLLVRVFLWNTIRGGGRGRGGGGGKAIRTFSTPGTPGRLKAHVR